MISRFWANQDVKYTFTADLTGTGDRSVYRLYDTVLYFVVLYMETEVLSCKSNWTVDNRHIFTMQLRSIVQQEYYVRLQLHFCSDHMLTLFSLHMRSWLQHLLLGIHWTLTLDLLKHSQLFRRKLKTELF